MSDSLSLVSPQFNDDILFYLLSFLDDPLDVVHIFTTNRRLSGLASNPYLWQKLLHKYFSQELELYASAYKKNPFELFKNLYLFRLKQYYVAFGLKTCKKEDFLLFLNMNLGYIDEIGKLKKIPPQKLIKIHGFMMSQKNFEEIETKYGSSPKEEREKIYGQAIIFCCRHNHPEELKLIVERYHEYIDVNKAVEPGLRLAARLEHIDCMDVLLGSRKIAIPSQFIAELLTLTCSSNKKRTLDYLLNYRQEMIPDHVYGYAFTLWCQHDQTQLEKRFFKKLTLHNIQCGVLNALRFQHVELAEKILNYFDLSDNCFYFEKMGLKTFAEENCLSGFLFLFKRLKINLESAFVRDLLRTANQNNAFDIMQFLLDFYQEKLPTYLAQQAKLKLEQAVTPVMIEQSPTLIFSEMLNSQIDSLSEKLQTLSITCSSEQNNNNRSSCSL